MGPNPIAREEDEIRTQTRVEKDHVRTQGGAGHLEAEQSSLRRNSAAQHLDLGV